MTKQLVIKLLSLHIFVAGLMPAGNVLELAKLPVLISHYQQEHATNSVWRFLYDHYAGEHNQEHQRDHEALPLHCCLHQVVALALPPVLRLPELLPQTLEFPAAQRYGGEYVASTPRGVARIHLQPPRPAAAFAASQA